jgi:Tol biopolymer transport system component
MTELKELFDMVTNKTEPDLDSWREQETRQRRAMRNRKLGAVALVAALLIGIGIFALASRPRSGTQPASQPVTVAPATLKPSVQDVAVVDLEGNPVQAILGLPADAYGLSLSVDGTKIAFVTASGQPSVDQIATIGTDGSGMRVLATEGIVASMPAWSPDGTLIAFEGSTSGTASNIYVMNADGSNVRQLTTDPAYDQYPQWSPDGSTIAYDNSGSRTDQNDPQYSPTTDIWTIPVDGGAPTRLTTAPGADAHPSFSPDGSQIAYYHAVNDKILVMDADGSDTHTIRGAGGFTPRWSPDGTRIAFTTYDDSYQPFVDFGATSRHAPLVLVSVVVVATGEHRFVGDVGMATDLNTPQWWSNDRLLIRRVGH